MLTDLGNLSSAMANKFTHILVDLCYLPLPAKAYDITESKKSFSRPKTFLLPVACDTCVNALVAFMLHFCLNPHLM